MENMVISLNAVLPLFLIIALGCAAKQLHILSDDAARQANGLCFKLFMAPLLFYNVYSTDLASAYSWKLLVFCVVGTLAEFAFGLLLIPHIEPSRPAQGVMLQAFCRPNIVLLGLPLSTALFGPENIGHIAFMLAVLVPLINILAVLALELFRGGTPNPKRILLGVAKNPFVLGAVAGFLCKLLQIQLPYVLDSVISSMAEAATPLALVLMGTSMNLRPKSYRLHCGPAVCGASGLSLASCGPGLSRSSPVRGYAGLCHPSGSQLLYHGFTNGR